MLPKTLKNLSRIIQEKEREEVDNNNPFGKKKEEGQTRFVNLKKEMETVTG
jgi:hypothetical protein